MKIKYDIKTEDLPVQAWKSGDILEVLEAYDHHDRGYMQELHIEIGEQLVVSECYPDDTWEYLVDIEHDGEIFTFSWQTFKFISRPNED